MLGLRMNMPLNLMAYYGSFAIAVTLLLRLVFKKLLPKPLFPLFWVMIMVRLLIPFSISSPLSRCVPTLPTLKPPAALEISHGTSENGMTKVPLDSAPQLDWSVVVSVLFYIGVAVTVAVLLLQMRHYENKLRYSLPLTENKGVNIILHERNMDKVQVLTCDCIDTPLVHGLFHPRIYLPASMNFDNDQHLRYILLHELAHIKLGHNWLKTTMLMALCLNWYNPLVWVMAYCMGADLESACDSAVMKQTGGNERHDYAKSLLAMSITEKRPALIYSSFAKTAVEKRIRGVLTYKKATVLTLALTVCLLLGGAVAVATVGQAEFTVEVSSTQRSASRRWLLRADRLWDVPLAEDAKARADAILAELLAADVTDDTAFLEQQLQIALSQEFGAPPSAFTLSTQLLGTDEDFNAEYAQSGVTTDELGRYLYQDELVRMTDDPVRGFGNTNPLGTVDILIQRDSRGAITHIVTYYEGDALYDERTKQFPKSGMRLGE